MMKQLLILSFFAAFFQKTAAQTVTWSTPGCSQTNPNLHMVVYQDCTPAEGTKEFLHLTTGTSFWNVADLAITGSQNSTIAPNGPCSYSPGDFNGNISATNALNSIAGCSPQLFQVAPATIPPNSKVIVIPNVIGAFAVPPFGGSFTAAAFASLCGKGPIYVIGATAKAGCTNGIFANQNTACPSNCNRNIVINFGGGCTATINYDITDPALPYVPTAANFTPGCGTGNALTNTSGCFPIPCETPDVSVNIAPNSKLCANSTQNINFTLTTNAPVGSYYSWSGPNGFTSTAASPTVNNPGFSAGNYVYNVTVCVPGGCSKASSVTVTIIDNPLTVTASLDPTSVLCVNATQSIKLSANVVGAPGILTYAWSSNTTPSFSSSAGPNTTHNPSPNLPVGTYTYTVTATSVGCAKSASTSVTVTNGLSFTPQSDITVCGSFAIPLSVTPTPSGTATYVWSGSGLSSTSSATPSATALLPTAPSNVLTTNYTVTVTENGCKWNDDFNIVVFAPPTGNIPAVPNVCKGTNFNLSVTGTLTGIGTTYSWSGPGFTSSVQNPTGISSSNLPIGANVYTVTMTNGPCVRTLTTTVNVSNNISTPPIINGSKTICVGAYTTLNAGAGYSSYLWSNGSTSQTANFNQAGFVAVTVTEPSGCQATTNTILSNYPTPTAIINGNNVVCAGAFTTLNATGGNFINYAWSNGQTGSSISAGSGFYNVTVTDVNGCTATASKAVSQDAVFVAIIGNQSVCNGKTTQLSTNSAFNIYQWSNGSNTPTIDVTAGTYSLTVTNINGCTGISAKVINQASIPSVSIVGNTSPCQGTNSILTTNPNNFSNYFWSNGSSSASLNTSTSGTYIVTVSDANGCTNVATTTVVVNPNPTPKIAGATTICAGASTKLDGGSGYSAYKWSTGELTSSITVNQTGLIGLTVTDINGCKGTDSKTITSGGTLNFSITGKSAFCEDESTELNAGSGFTSYKWSTGASTPTIMVNTTGTYAVTVTNGVCSGTASINVTKLIKPSFTITKTGTFCEGQSTMLNIVGNFSQYLWDNGSLTQNIIISKSGTYSSTVTDINGCIATNSISVQQDKNPTISIIGKDKICSGSTGTMLSVTPDNLNNYFWNTGESTPSILANLATKYSVTATDSNGCSAIASKTLVLAPNFITQLNSSICEGNTYSFFGKNLDKTGTYQQTLNALNGCDSVITLNLKVLPTDTITIKKNVCEGSGGTFYNVFKKENGCDSIIKMVVTVSIPQPITITQQGNVLTASPQIKGAMYQWFLDGKAIAGANGAIFTQFVDGAYHIEVIDENACKSKSNVIQIGKIATKDTDLADIRIFPNPTLGLIYIKNEYQKIQNINIINTLGQINSLFLNNNTIDIANFPKGVYQLQISLDNGKDAFFKVIKL